MIDKICEFLTNRIRKEMPEIDDDRAAVINYGLQNIIGELPKIIFIIYNSIFLRNVKRSIIYVYNIITL